MSQELVYIFKHLKYSFGKLINFEHLKNLLSTDF